VVAYPAFLWAVFALHAAAGSPGSRRDLAMVVSLAVATLARTQFAVLIVVVPVALFVQEVAWMRDRSPLRRIAAAGRRLVSAHRPLAIAYAAAACVVGGLLLAHRFSGALGTYSVTAEGNVFPSGMGRSLIEHLAPLALGLGIVPFILGVAWLTSTLIAPQVREQLAFAAIATVTILALLLEVTSYDLRFGRRTVHDRYLFYVVPLVLIAFASLLRNAR